MRRLTSLEHVWPALVAEEPASGYTLRKSFASTPLGHDSNGPGPICPALQRLRRRGLIGAVIELCANRWRQQRFAVTRKGIKQLCAGLKRAIPRGEVMNQVDDLMLRFVGAQTFGEASASPFAVEFGQRIAETLSELQSHLRGLGRALPPASPSSKGLKVIAHSRAGQCQQKMNCQGVPDGPRHANLF